MGTPYIGEIRLTSFNFPPKGWALCNGQLLSIQQNPALFSLFGTFYGGDGIRTFALPNMQSRVPIHMGQGNGLSNYVIGQQGGVESVTLQYNSMPLHTHLVVASTNFGSSNAPAGDILAQTNGGTVSAPVAGQLDFVTTAATGNMEQTTIGQQGGNQPHSNIQPYLVINFIVALVGIFPSRN
jgi:microcystin-dependent protein